MIQNIKGNLIESNIFVFSKNDKCIVIDAGVEVEQLKKLIKGKSVEAVLLTHGHYDHCYYALDYQKEFGCKIYCSKLAKNYLENPDYNYSEGRLTVNDFSNFVFLENNGVLNIADFDIEYYQLGGHSMSDMAFEIDGNIFVGDVLIGRDMGRIDLYGGSKEQMKTSLEFLLNQNYVTMYSGHGEPNDKRTQDKVIKVWLRFLSR